MSAAFAPNAAAPVARITRETLRRAGLAYPVLPILLVAAALLPEDLNIRPGGLLLTMPRLLLLLSSPLIVIRLARRVAACTLRIRACDIFVCATAFWMFLSVWMTEGPARAFVGSSVLILELCGSYALIRASLMGVADAVLFARWAAYLMAANALVGVLDVVTGRHILHDITQSLTGYSKEWRFDYRAGILRSQGMQEHPILLGVVCACGAVLALYTMRGMARLALCACCMVGLLASDSSAPFGAFLLACGLLAYHRLTQGFPGRWRILMVTAGVMIAALLTLHPRPFSFLLDHFTANPQDGYYRLLIWSVCGPLVLDNPIFGVGLESDFADRFEVAKTVDTVWLASAMDFGIPGAVLIAGMLISACVPAVRRARAFAVENADLGRALGVIIFLYIYLGLTVDYWGCTWILMGIFAALRLHLGDRGAAGDR